MFVVAFHDDDESKLGEQLINWTSVDCLHGVNLPCSMQFSHLNHVIYLSLFVTVVASASPVVVILIISLVIPAFTPCDTLYATLCNLCCFICSSS